MEYPKTIEEVLKKLQGRWKYDNQLKSFEISNWKVTNPVGIIGSFNEEITNDMPFKLRFNDTNKKWQIACGSVFGHDWADIIHLDGASLITSISPVVGNSIVIGDIPSLLDPIKTKFTRPN